MTSSSRSLAFLMIAPAAVLASQRLLDALLVSGVMGLLWPGLVRLQPALGAAPRLAPWLPLIAYGTAGSGIATYGALALGLFPVPQALPLTGLLTAGALWLARQTAAEAGQGATPRLGTLLGAALLWWGLAAFREGLGAGTLGAGLPSGPLWQGTEGALVPTLQSSAAALLMLAALSGLTAAQGPAKPPSPEALAARVKARRVRVTGPVK